MKALVLVVFAATGFAAHAQPLSPDPDGGALRARGFQRGRASDARAQAAAPAPVSPSSPPAIAASAKVDGRALYLDTCALCHMADGKGEPGLQPPLVGSGRLSGDVKLLVDLILRGPKAVLPPSNVEWASEMPELPDLSDQEIAAVLTFARKRFGRGASAVTPAQVAAQRQKHGIPPAAPAK